MASHRGLVLPTERLDPDNVLLVREQAVFEVERLESGILVVGVLHTVERTIATPAAAPLHDDADRWVVLIILLAHLVVVYNLSRLSLDVLTIPCVDHFVDFSLHFVASNVVLYVDAGCARGSGRHLFEHFLHDLAVTHRGPGAAAIAITPSLLKHTIVEIVSDTNDKHCRVDEEHWLTLNVVGVVFVVEGVQDSGKVLDKGVYYEDEVLVTIVRTLRRLASLPLFVHLFWHVQHVAKLCLVAVDLLYLVC